MELSKSFIHEFLLEIGYYELQLDLWQRFTIALGIFLFAGGIYYTCLKIFVPLIKQITNRTSVKWDDHLLNYRVMKSLCQLIFVITVYVLIPLSFKENGITYILTMRILKAIVVAMIAKLIISFISSLYLISKEHDNLGKKPLQGIYQMFKIIVICISSIMMISIILDKNPNVLLTGIGASAAIIMLVFKDPILGLVSGIQLSANDMLRPGDWIVMNKYGADGTVFEITLTTIKVRNWDNTIVTLPPYLLVSDSFQNWRGMEESGGRRIKRYLSIDMSSIRFCTKEEICRYKTKGWLKHCNNNENELSNLTVLRSYIEEYLFNNENINNNLTMIVRHLQPTAEGLPLEIYCFSSIKTFKSFENVQSNIFEHILSVIPEFGLKIFQAPSGNDIQYLKDNRQ